MNIFDFATLRSLAPIYTKYNTKKSNISCRCPQQLLLSLNPSTLNLHLSTLNLNLSTLNRRRSRLALHSPLRNRSWFTVCRIGDVYVTMNGLLTAGRLVDPFFQKCFFAVFVFASRRSRLRTCLWCKIHGREGTQRARTGFLVFTSVMFVNQALYFGRASTLLISNVLSVVLYRLEYNILFLDPLRFENLSRAGIPMN